MRETGFNRRSSGRIKKDIRGVSEAVGTVLLLGMSVVLAGGLALWAGSIDEGEESIYVDIWAKIDGNDLVISHRGGDFLAGWGTYIQVRNQDGSDGVSKDTYTHFSGTGDENWWTGESVTIDISGVSTVFDVIVTTTLSGGMQTIVLSSTMVKPTVSSGVYCDLAITQFMILDPSDNILTTILDHGVYYIVVNVTNFGQDMTEQYFSVEADNTISNLRLFDTSDRMNFTNVNADHFNATGAEVTVDWGEMKQGDYMEFRFEWSVSVNLPRTLGQHTMNIKVLPYSDGEENYANNYVTRRFKVDKEIIPVLIHGPDPGIYDISFSNTAPHSGEEIVVTVIIQNKGEEPIEPDHNVILVVSTWEPRRMITPGDHYFPESYDWKVDAVGDDYGKWKSDVPEISASYDTEFPTCIIPGITLLPGAYFFYYFTLEARVDVPGGEQKVYASIDVYESQTHPQGIAWTDGDDPGDNSGVGQIQVLPRIMVVDDDDAATGTEEDMTSTVLESLVGAGVTVDKLYVAQEIEDNGTARDTPAFDYVQDEVNAPAMEDYDIVVWVTGYVEDPLTNKPVEGTNIHGGNIQEMMRYLDAKKYLLIVGASPFGRDNGLTGDVGLYKYFKDGETDVPNDELDNAYTDQDADYVDASAFVRNYLCIKVITTRQDLPSSTPYQLEGTDTGEGGITQLFPGEDYYNLTTEDLIAGNGLAQLMEPVADMNVMGFLVRDESDSLNETYVSIRSWSDPDPETSAQYKFAILSWDVNRMVYLNEKIRFFAGILRWMDWEIHVGRDLAVTKMELFILGQDASGNWTRTKLEEGVEPRYLDTMEIEVRVRNNGPSSESTSLMFYVTGPDNIELPIPGIPDPRQGGDDKDENPQDVSNLPGQGGEVTVYKLWLAVGVGSYTFRVVVDPFHLITEVSEDNNDITYSTSTIQSFVTQNNILIVDDDMSADNFAIADQPQAQTDGLLIDYTDQGGEPSDVTDQVLQVIGYDLEVHTVTNVYVSGSGWSYNSGLTIDDLKRFNSVIWVTGDSGDGDPDERETLADGDIQAIVNYLDGSYPEAEYLDDDHRENIMFIGTNLTGDLAANNDLIDLGPLSIQVHDFVRDYLGIVPVEGDSGIYRSIEGPTSGGFTEDIYVGVVYGDADFTDDFYYESLTAVDFPEPPVQRAVEGIFGVNDTSTRLIGVQYEVTDDTPLEAMDYRFFRTLTHSWQMGMADHDEVETSLMEIMYLSLHWFETPEYRPELVSRDCKIEFENENPVLGNSYIVTVDIVNIGGAGGGGTVRFTDGSTLIKSENIYIDPGQTTTLEAIWTPLYAGDREMKVWIDIHDDYDEVFDLMNNNPSKTREIFFFWDDMESGAGNWDHDSTVLLINGEGKLDYMEEPTNMDIDYTWKFAKGWQQNDQVANTIINNEFHTAPKSFFMHEPRKLSQYRIPIDMVMVIDTSGSMSGQKIDDAKAAAKNVVGMMTQVDQLALYSFNDEEFRQDESFTEMTDANKLILNNTIDSYVAGGYTPIWDTTGEAVNYAEANRRPGDIFAAVISLTDGDDFGTDGREDGSEIYCPGSEPETSYLTHTWGRTDGLRWGDPSVQFRKQDGTNKHDVIRYGGDGLSNVRTWCDLADDTRTGLIYAPLPVYTIGLGIDPHEADPENPTLGNDYPVTSEFDLWRIAETSGASYHYAPDSSTLEEIFLTIFLEVEERAQSSTRSGDTRGINPWSDGTTLAEDKNIDTNPIDLTNVDSAELSFYHKYNMKRASNGGVIMVGLSETEPGPYTYMYIQPDQPYTGNILISSWENEDRKDDFGASMRWCWNGLSGGGTLGWEYITVDLDRFTGYFVKLRFFYMFEDGGTGYGWIVDDVMVRVNSLSANPDKYLTQDIWALKKAPAPGIQSHSGDYAWFCGGEDYSDLKGSLDNSLYTRQIDLTNAGTATLQANLRFNLDSDAGRPPDGFRVEVSTDNGEVWIPLNLGVRSSWSVSGTEADIDDGTLDNKSYTGLDTGAYWVSTGTMTRLITKLDGFTGNVVILRFRVVTNTDPTHNEDGYVFNPLSDEFFGIYVDDVIIYGDSLESSRSDQTEVDEGVGRTVEGEMRFLSGVVEETRFDGDGGSSASEEAETMPETSDEREGQSSLDTSVAASDGGLWISLAPVLLLSILAALGVAKAVRCTIKRI